jgi:ABC-2 type transport system ATP-binding protein
MTELEALPGVRRVEPLGDSRLRVHHCADSDIPEVLVSESAKRDWGLFELVAERRSLEEIFVALTCREPSSEDDQNGPVIAEAA